MSIANVLAVVGDESPQTGATLHAAVELAARENSRLTLAKTCASVGGCSWMVPLGAGVAYVEASLESPEQACRTVARIARDIPPWLPVATLVLTQKPQTALLGLIAAGSFGAVVAEAGLLAKCRRLRRLMVEHGVIAVPVPVPMPVPAPLAAAGPQDAGPSGERTGGEACGGPAAAGGPSGYLAPGSPVPIR